MRPLGGHESGPCQHQHHKRTNSEIEHDTSPDPAPKKAKAMGPSIKALDSVFAIQQTSLPASTPSYQPFEGVDFGVVCWSSPASIIEPPQVSPTSNLSTALFSSGGSGILEIRSKPSMCTENQLFPPPKPGVAIGCSDASLGVDPSPVDNFSHSFDLSKDFLDIPVFEPPPSAGSTTAQFGSIPGGPICLNRVAGYNSCDCSECRPRPPWTYFHRRNSSFGWRRASSIPLPTCYTNHPPESDSFRMVGTPPLSAESTYSEQVSRRLRHGRLTN